MLRLPVRLTRNAGAEGLRRPGDRNRIPSEIVNGRSISSLRNTARKTLLAAFAERLEENARAAEIAARLPEALRLVRALELPGWEGSCTPTPDRGRVARDGLREYVLHPLLRTRGSIAATTPHPRGDLERYAGQLPPGFPVAPRRRKRHLAGARRPDSRAARRKSRLPPPAALPRGDDPAVPSHLRGPAGPFASSSRGPAGFRSTDPIRRALEGFLSALAARISGLRSSCGTLLY